MLVSAKPAILTATDLIDREENKMTIRMKQPVIYLNHIGI
jgi:hypothetical protein